MIRIIRLSVPLALSLCLCLPCVSKTGVTDDGPAVDHGAPIRIGLMMTFTGNGSTASTDALNGFKLYWKQSHNMAEGRPIRLFVEDDQNSPEVALVKANKLIHHDHVDIFAGLRTTPIAYFLAPKIDTEYKLPFVVMISSGDELTSTRHPHWLVRTEFSTRQLIAPLGDYAYKHAGLRRIATVAVRNAWGFEGVGNFQQTFENLGGKVVQKIWIARDATNMKAKLKDLRKDVDAIFQMTDETNSTAVVQALKELGVRVPILSHGGVTDTEPVDLAALPQYITVLPYTNNLKTTANSNFVHAYESEYHTTPRYFAELGYTTAMILRSAIARAKGKVTDKEQLLQAIRSVEVEAPSGHKKFDDFGQLVQNIYVRRLEMVDGKAKNVNLLVYPNVSQFWTFDPNVVMKAPAFAQDVPPCRFCQ